MNKPLHFGTNIYPTWRNMKQVHHTWHVQTAFCQYYYVPCAPWTTLYSSKDTYLFCFCLMSLEKPSMTDLCCFCTATNNTLLVKFDEGKSRLPFAETCFYALTLPTIHQTYEEFNKYTCINITLKHGSLGLHHSGVFNQLHTKTCSS